MSAANADQSKNPSIADDNAADSHDGSVIIDLLSKRVELLIQTCRELDQRKRACQETTEQLIEENNRLRSALTHTQQQIKFLIEQIKQIEG